MYTLCFHLGIKTKRQSVLPASFAVYLFLPASSLRMRTIHGEM